MLDFPGVLGVEDEVSEAPNYATSSTQLLRFSKDCPLLLFTLTEADCHGRGTLRAVS